MSGWANICPEIYIVCYGIWAVSFSFFTGQADVKIYLEFIRHSILWAISQRIYYCPTGQKLVRVILREVQVGLGSLGRQCLPAVAKQ